MYGAFVNIDSFTVGEQKEVFEGIRIFELAKQAGTVKHYVWSSLDNVFKVRRIYPQPVNDVLTDCLIAGEL